MILQTDHKICLPCGVNDIRDFTINNCHFYFLERSGCKLIKWCPNTHTTETFILKQKYLCICYDHKENCYWAIPECNPYLIDKLDIRFHKIGHITLIGCQGQHPISLCCDDQGKCLLLCYACQLAYVNKCNGEIIFNQNLDNNKINLGSVAQCNCRVNCYYQCGRQILEINSQCKQKCIEICIPKEYKMIGISSYNCTSLCKECRFCVLLLDVCSHELILMEYCVDFSHDKCKPFPKPCPPETHHGVYEILHSIALEEAGISHILNAEGEKIQKAVAISDNIDDLICVNESVKRTLTQVTLLEGMLYSKLEAALSYKDNCKPKKPCHTQTCSDYKK